MTANSNTPNSSSHASTTSTKSEQRAPLPHSAPGTPPQAKATGPVDPAQILTVSIVTRRRKPLQLDSLGGRTISHQEFAENYGGDPADFETLRSFAHAHGLAVDESASSLPRRTLVVRGTAAAMQAAFGVKLEGYAGSADEPVGTLQASAGNDGKTGGTGFHCFKGQISVPATHANLVESGLIQAVLGLDTRPVAKPHFRLRKNSSSGSVVAHAGTTGSFTPVQIASLYNFPTGVNGAGETIGILELGGGYETSDITSFFGSLNLTPPTVVAVSVDGGTNVPGGDPSGADGEVALDIQVAGAVAPGAKIAVYFTPNTDQGFIDAITTAVHDTANNPSVLSISWGGPESGWAAASRTALDDACQSAAALGVTITVASGDNGSTDGGTGNNVDFPASSPHVLACGGTALKGSGSTISSEVVWDDLSGGGGATGGGVSTVFALPSWQANAGVPAASGSTGGRGVPDVSGDASPETGYGVWVDGTQEVVGGTSAVAPLWAGLIALINQQRGTPAGLINPALYANPSALRDITSGNNGAFKAAKGWDACTGLGSPNGVAVAAALAGSGSGGVTPPPTTTPAPTTAPEPVHKKHHKHEE